MSSYVGTSTQAIALNTTFDVRRARSTSRSGAGLRRSRSVSLWADPHVATSTTCSKYGVECCITRWTVAAAADATHNVAQQALETASQAIETARQGKAHARKLFDTVRDELRAKFDEDRMADETKIASSPRSDR